MRRINFDQPAQAMDLHIDRTVEGLAIVAARPDKQAFALHRPAGIGDQCVEQGEFATGQQDFLTSTRPTGGCRDPRLQSPKQKTPPRGSGAAAG